MAIPKPPFVAFKKDRQLKNLETGKFIFEVGESRLLREKSKEIPLNKFKSKEIKEKFNYVKKCLLKYRKITGFGRGITAVQVGIPLKFSAIYQGQNIRNVQKNINVTARDILIVANPKILKLSKKLLKYPEMCMSLSPVIVPVIRPSWIEFEYFDENGEKKLWDKKDDTEVNIMMNRVFMHELDHMEGIVNIDKVKDPRSILLQADPDFYSSAKFEVIK